MKPTRSTLEEPLYLDCDGQRMSDNTLQFLWIVMLQTNLDAMYRLRPDVFVAGDLLWYPARGLHRVRMAPDVMVVFGRPKGYRGSYKQWEEEDVGPQVVFEVLSPGNRTEEMDRKFEFYETHRVQEYYLYDPHGVELSGWLHQNGALEPVAAMNGWVSPRLSIRFDMSGPELVVYRPDGQRFSTFVELQQQAEDAKQRAEQLAAKLRALGVDPDA